MVNSLLIWEDGENEIGITAAAEEGAAVMRLYGTLRKPQVTGVEE